MGKQLTIVALGKGGFSVQLNSIELFSCDHRLPAYWHLTQALYQSKITFTQAEIMFLKLQHLIPILPSYLRQRPGTFYKIYQTVAKTQEEYEGIRYCFSHYRQYGHIIRPGIQTFPVEKLATIVYHPAHWELDEHGEVFLSLGITPLFENKKKGFSHLDDLENQQLLSPVDYDRLAQELAELSIFDD